MRRLLRYIFLKPVLWASQKFSSRPERKRIFNALDKLYADITEHNTKKGLVIPFDVNAGKVIIFSDQHKGGRDGADDFMLSETNYLTALDYYDKNEFLLIGLGDCEELWENTLGKVKESYPKTFDAERKFLDRKSFVKVLGNHDLYWGNDPFAWWQLKKIYNEDVKIYEALILEVNVGNSPLRIFCTHGHQGDAQSDGNWFSKFFVSNIWGPIQGLLDINPNTPAFNNQLKSLHNTLMYDWSSIEKNILLITGHTHQPVFMSLTHLERLYVKLADAQKNNFDAAIKSVEDEIAKAQPANPTPPDLSKIIPSYFNSGCCCFDDGDITGIEIAEGYIRLIKWQSKKDVPKREVLEEIKLNDLEDLLP